MAEEHQPIEPIEIADEAPVTSEQYVTPELEPEPTVPVEQEAGTGQRLWRLAGVGILIAIIILIALLLRDCAGDGGDLSDDGSKTIVPVSRYEPVAGVVSVWVSQDADIDVVMSGLAQRREDVVSLGNGQYIIAVGQGREQLAIDTLRARDGVYDAGLVYDKDNPVK